MLNHLCDRSEVDNQRVSAIRTRLDDDTYTVNIQQIAAKVIDIEVALSRPRKPKR